MVRRPFWVDFLLKRWTKTEISDQITAKSPCTRTTIFTKCNVFFLMVRRPFWVDFCSKNGQKMRFQTNLREKPPVPGPQFLQNVTFFSYGKFSFFSRFLSKKTGEKWVFKPKFRKRKTPLYQDDYLNKM